MDASMENRNNGMDRYLIDSLSGCLGEFGHNPHNPDMGDMLFSMGGFLYLFS